MAETPKAPQAGAGPEHFCTAQRLLKQAESARLDMRPPAMVAGLVAEAQAHIGLAHVAALVLQATRRQPGTQGVATRWVEVIRP